MDAVKQKHQRPSVLRHSSHTAARQQHAKSPGEGVSKDKREADHPSQTSLPRRPDPPAQLHHLLALRRRDGAERSSAEADARGSPPEESSAIFGSGLCRWPGCSAEAEDFPSFLKHLQSEHSHGDRSLAQWRVQQDVVHYMENQLVVEKQKLLAMQVHLHLSDQRRTDSKKASPWPYSLFLFLPRPQGPLADWTPPPAVGGRQLEEFHQHWFTASGSAHLLPDVVPSIECYKYNNIRPPYTYANLIRWSIMESPEKQRTLNEIYTWFTSMFYYFRHNTATWKNAVRHNLSLHKCFVRVEGGKGAVWTVDEKEFQRRKGQKYHRDCPVKWLSFFNHFCPEEA